MQNFTPLHPRQRRGTGNASTISPKYTPIFFGFFFGSVTYSIRVRWITQSLKLINCELRKRNGISRLRRRSHNEMRSRSRTFKESQKQSKKEGIKKQQPRSQRRKGHKSIKVTDLETTDSATECRCKERGSATTLTRDKLMLHSRGKGEKRKRKKKKRDQKTARKKKRRRRTDRAEADSWHCVPVNHRK